MKILEPNQSSQNPLNPSSAASKFGHFSSYPTEVVGDISIYRGSAGNDYLMASSGKNQLYGLAGDDVLKGSNGDDFLNGGTGNDFLMGNQGNDVLIDRDGGDLLNGGAGADQFQIAGAISSQNSTTISDFEIGTDTIKILDLGTTYDQLTFKEITSKDIISSNGVDSNLEIASNDMQSGVEIYALGKAIARLNGIKASDLKPDSFFLEIHN